MAKKKASLKKSTTEEKVKPVKNTAKEPIKTFPWIEKVFKSVPLTKGG